MTIQTAFRGSVHKTVRRPERAEARRRSLSPVAEALEVRSLLSTFTVLNTRDAGAGSLRQAIIAADAQAGSSTIVFKIPRADSGYQAATNSFTIQPLSPLPAITRPVTLDGFLKPGATSGTPGIDLDGSRAGYSEGLALNASSAGSVIEGLAVSRFQRSGIYVYSSGDTFRGLRIGTDVTGTRAEGNTFNGIYIDASNTTVVDSLASANLENGVSIIAGNSNIVLRNDLLGTDASGTRSLGDTYSGVYSAGDDVLVTGSTVAFNKGSFGIYFSGTNNVVQGSVVSGNLGTGIGLEGANDSALGDLVGTNASGTSALGNDRYGIIIAANTADATIRGNVVSGNGEGGIFAEGYGSVIAGNMIGTNLTGQRVLNNNGPGVVLFEDSGDTVGGSKASDRNVISGNTLGVEVEYAGDDIVEGNDIGTNASGTVALGNSLTGVTLTGSAETTVRNNLISANAAGGVSIHGFAYGFPNTVSGNMIGTNASGNLARGMGNGAAGVTVVDDSDNAMIGGETAADANIIRGNFGPGVLLETTQNYVLNNVITNNQGPGVASGNLAGTGFLPGNTLPNATLTDQNGKAVSLASYRGEYVLVDFCGAWCSNCQEEAGEIPALQAYFQSIGVRFQVVQVLVQNFNEETADVSDARLWASTFGLTNPILTGPGASNLFDAMSATTGLAAFPTDFVVGPTGTVLGQTDGAVPATTFENGIDLLAGIPNPVALGALASPLISTIGQNVVSGNAIDDNGGPGIAWNGTLQSNVSAGQQTAGNTLVMNSPVITSASGLTVSGTFQGPLPDEPLEIDLYTGTSPSRNGHYYLGSVNVTTSSNATASFTIQLSAPLPSGTYVTATAIDLSQGTSLSGTTSEFSNPFQVGRA